MNEQSRPRTSNQLTTLAYVLIGLGAVILISRLGGFDFTTYLGILRFWPILVIAAGIDLLTKGKWRVAVYGVGIAAMVLLSLAGGSLVGGPAGSVAVAQDLQGASSAQVHVSTSVARLELRGSPQATLLAEGSLEHHAGEQVRVDYAVRGNRGQFDASTRRTGSTFMGSGRSVRWDLTLTGRVPIALSVDTGVGESELDLRQLQLESLSVNAGVGRTSVRLPARGGYRASIDGGVGEIVLQVPRALPIRISVDTGIGSVIVPDHFTRNGDVYTSSSYGASSAAVELEIDAGVGAVRVQVVD